MKFLTACMQEHEAGTETDATDKKFGEFLRQQNLTPNLLHYVCHSIAMVSPNESVTKGLAATKKFLSSLGRFGPTPFLWSMYGTGELPQVIEKSNLLLIRLELRYGIIVKDLIYFRLSAVCVQCLVGYIISARPWTSL